MTSQLASKTKRETGKLQEKHLILPKASQKGIFVETLEAAGGASNIDTM